MKWRVYKTGHCPQSTADVMNAWSHNSPFPYAFMACIMTVLPVIQFWTPLPHTTTFWRKIQNFVNLYLINTEWRLILRLVVIVKGYNYSFHHPYAEVTDPLAQDISDTLHRMIWVQYITHPGSQLLFTLDSPSSSIHFVRADALKSKLFLRWYLTQLRFLSRVWSRVL